MVPAIGVGLLADHPAALPRVARWLHDEWFEAWGLTHRQSEAELALRVRRDALPLALVATWHARVVGTASLVVAAHPLEPHAVCMLAGVYVLPRWRGRGIGSRLCADAVALAPRLSQRPLGLYTGHGEAFYARLGWRKRLDTPLPGPATPSLGVFMEWCGPR